MNYVDTYSIATFGINTKNTYTISVLGYNLQVKIDDITPTPPPISSGGFISSGLSNVIRRRERNKQVDKKTVNTNVEKPPIKPTVERTKKITVCVTINGVEYCKAELIKTKPNITIDDVDVIINDKTPKPKITIKLKK